jgi:hypothetical protein
MWVMQLKRRNLVWVLNSQTSISKEENNSMCVLSPHGGIIVEEEKFNMCFANDIYLIIKKSKNRFVSLVLVGF